VSQCSLLNVTDIERDRLAGTGYRPPTERDVDDAAFDPTAGRYGSLAADKDAYSSLMMIRFGCQVSSTLLN